MKLIPLPLYYHLNQLHYHISSYLGQEFHFLVKNFIQYSKVDFQIFNHNTLLLKICYDSN